MLLNLDDETLLIYPYPDRQEFRIDLSVFPRGVPYHIVEKDSVIRFIPWLDATTPRAKLSLTGKQYKQWITDDGWSMIGIYARNQDKLSKFDHMIWRAPSFSYKTTYNTPVNYYDGGKWRTIEMNVNSVPEFDIYLEPDGTITAEPKL